MADFLPAAELACKSVRNAFGALGALVDAMIPKTSAAGAGAEGPGAVSAGPTSTAPAPGHPDTAVPPAAVTDPAAGVSPRPPAAGSLTHLAECLRDAVGDHYDFACRPYDQFPFWHNDHLIDAFDWEGATNAFLEDVRRAFDPQHPQYDNKFQK